MGRNWAAEERDHTLRVAATYDRLVAAQSALVPDNGPGGRGPPAGDPDPQQFQDFNTALAAYEDAKDARDAFFDERRRGDSAWIES